MDFWVRAAQLILSLSILIVLHEFGHFIPARIFKIRVEKFYLFFDPWFSLFKKKIKGVEWGIGWLPLGGYVKIAGMVDESMDKEQMALPPKEDEFRAKPAWQRLIVMIGGVTVNIIVGFLIYIFVIFGYGTDYATNEDLKNGIAVNPKVAALNLGFEDGDKVLSLDGEKVENVLNLPIEIWARGKRKVEVEHLNGEKETITLPETIGEGEDALPLDKWMFQENAIRIFSPREKVKIDSVIVDTNRAVLEKGDIILSVNNKETPYFHLLQHEVSKYADTTVSLAINRAGIPINVLAYVSDKGALGFYNKSEFTTQHRTYSFGESIGAGLSKAGWTIHDYVVQLKYLFTKKGASSVGGFGTIGKLFPTEWNWEIFWLNTAFISLILAVMNILPIPALDGGHVVFLIYEIVTGKEAPQKVLEYAQVAGFVLLMSLLLYANGADIYRAIFGG